MKRIKDSYEITELISGKKFSDEYDEEPLYILFCKDTCYNGEQFNKNSLIIIHNNYVVNNDMRFHSLEIKKDNNHDTYIFHSILNPKKTNKTFTFKFVLM